MSKSELFRLTEFTGHYPVGTAAVVIANDEDQACRMLEDILLENGLRQEIKPEMLKRVSMGATRAILLCDGNY